MTDRAETVMPDGAFVERHIGIDGGAWGEETVDEEAKWEEKREEEGSDWNVDDWA